MASLSLARRLAAQSRSLAAYATGPVLGLVTAPLLARSLGPEGRGELAAVLIVLTVAAPLATLGMPAAVTVAIGRQGQPQATFQRAVRASVGSTALVYVGLLAYAAFLSSSTGLAVPFLALAWATIFVSAVVQLRRAMWQGAGAWSILDRERATYGIARAVGVVLLVSLGVGESEYFVASSLAAFVLAATWLWSKRPTDEPQGTAVPISELRAFSWRAAVGTVSSAANNRLDQVILPALVSLAELGYYSVAVTVAEVPMIAATVASRNYLHGSSTGRSGASLVRVGAFPLAACFLGCGLLAIFVPTLLPAFFGREFQPAVASTLVLLAGTGVGAVTVCLTAVLTGRGRPGVASIVSFTSLGTVVLLFVLLSEDMNSMSAAVVALFAQLAGLALAIVFLLIRGRSGAGRRTHVETSPPPREGIL